MPRKTLIVCFDTETTGLDTRNDHVVQLSSVAYFAGEPASVVEFNRFANPGKAIHPMAVKTHGITNAQVAEEPSSRAVAQFWWQCFKDYAKEQAADLLLVAHNGHAYDIPMLQKYFDDLDWPGVPVLDTLVVARRLDPTAANHRLGHLVGTHYRLDSELATRAHDGLADCYMVAKLLDYYLERTQRTVSEMLNWINDPVTLAVVPFGRHKGTPFASLDEKSLLWYLRQPRMDRDILHTVKGLLHGH